MENEEGIDWRHEPRRYAEIFTNLGCELIETIPAENFPEDIDLGSNYKAHVLKTE